MCFPPGRQWEWGRLRLRRGRRRRRRAGRKAHPAVCSTEAAACDEEAGSVAATCGMCRLRRQQHAAGHSQALGITWRAAQSCKAPALPHPPGTPVSCIGMLTSPLATSASMQYLATAGRLRLPSLLIQKEKAQALAQFLVAKYEGDCGIRGGQEVGKWVGSAQVSRHAHWVAPQVALQQTAGAQMPADDHEPNRLPCLPPVWPLPFNVGPADAIGKQAGMQQPCSPLPSHWRQSTARRRLPGCLHWQGAFQTAVPLERGPIQWWRWFCRAQ